MFLFSVSLSLFTNTPKASTQTTLTMRPWKAATISSWGGRLVVFEKSNLFNPSLFVLAASLHPSLSPAAVRSSSWSQITPSKTSAAPPLLVSTTSVSRSPPPLSRAIITTGVPNGNPQTYCMRADYLSGFLKLNAASLCRYQSLNLTNIPEHSVPVFEFRWRGQGGRSLRWNRNDGALLTSLQGNKRRAESLFLLPWEQASGERTGKARRNGSWPDDGIFFFFFLFFLKFWFSLSFSAVL